MRGRMERILSLCRKTDPKCSLRLEGAHEPIERGSRLIDRVFGARQLEEPGPVRCLRDGAQECPVWPGCGGWTARHRHAATEAAFDSDDCDVQRPHLSGLRLRRRATELA